MHHLLAKVMNATFKLRDVLPDRLIHFPVHRFYGEQKGAISVKFCHADLVPANGGATNERSRYRTENEIARSESSSVAPLTFLGPDFNKVLTQAVIVGDPP